MTLVPTHLPDPDASDIVSYTRSFYVTGGTVPLGAASYVERQADRDLLSALRAGEFCYVLDTRQMGKSSLMVRTAKRLREADIRVAVLDLTALGQNVTPEQWYDGLLLSLGEQLGMEDTLDDFWQENTRLGPMQRFFEAVTYAALAWPAPLIIFVDEVDAVRGLPFSSDEFFGGIRELYNRRTRAPEFANVTFCLLGVATPADLVRDTRLSPFNVGRRITLSDFTSAEAAPLAALLPQKETDLTRVLYWTGGHPYLTQKLCAEFGRSPTQSVDLLATTLFLSRSARESDDNLAFVRNRLLKGETDVASLLDLYAKVRMGKRVISDDTNPLVEVLRLSGVVVPDTYGFLRVRNRVYDHVFDLAWVRANLPNAEKERQRAAFRRGAFRAAGFGGVAVAVVGALGLRAAQSERAAIDARKTAEQERAGATIAADRATQSALQAAQSRTEAEKERDRARDAEARATQSANAARRALLAEAQARDAAASAARMATRAALGERGQRRIAQTQMRTAQIATAQTQSLLYVASMGLIEQAWEVSDLARVKQLLQETANDPNKGFEWFYWNRLRHLERFALPKARGAVTVVAALPEGSFFTGDTSGDIRIFDASGKPRRFWANAHPGGVTALATSHDGSLWATGGVDKMVRLWNARNKNRRVLGPLPGAITTLAFSPNNNGARLLFVGIADSPARLVDVASGQTVFTYPELNEGVYAAAFMPNGRQIVVAGRDATARVWNADTGRTAFLLEGHTERVFDVACSPDGRQIATASSDGTARLWNTDGQVNATLRGHTGTVRSIAFSPDSRFAATGGEDGSARVWSVGESGASIVNVLSGHIGPVQTVAFAANSQTLLTGGADQGTRIWDALSSRQALVLNAGGVNLPSAALSPDGSQIATAAADGSVRLWEARTGRATPFMARHDAPVNTIVWSPSGTQIVTGAADGSVCLWDARTSRLVQQISAPAPNTATNAAICSVAFSPDGIRLAIKGQSSNTAIFDVQSGKRVLLLNSPGATVRNASGAVAWSPDGQVLATTNPGGVFLWNTQTGRIVRNAIDTRDRCGLWITFSPDGKSIATSGRGGGLVWNTQDLVPQTALEGHTGFVWSVGFAPDGRRLVTAGQDTTARVWDRKTGHELLTLRGHGQGVNTAAFSPDGKAILTSGADGTARLWLADAHGISFAEGGALRQRQARLRDVNALMQSGHLAEAADALTRELRQTPEDSDLRRLRGTVYAQSDHFDLAVADFALVARATRRSTDMQTWATALLGAGDLAGYHGVCAQIARRPLRLAAASSADLFVSTWALALAPDSVSPSEYNMALAALARALTANAALPTRGSGTKADLLGVQGALLYRTGRFAEAARVLAQTSGAYYGVETELLRAMALQRSGQLDAAHAVWEGARPRAEAWRVRHERSRNWQDQIGLQQFTIEAETLLQKGLEGG